MFFVKKNKKAQRTLKFVREIPKRLAALRSHLAYAAAASTHARILDEVPNSAEWQAYREGLEVVQLGSRRSGMYALRLSTSKAKARGGGKIDPPTTLIYIRPHRRLAKVPPVIQILAKYSPWTAETLPFTPSKREALVVSRRSTKQVALRVAKQRKADRPFWSRELQKAGRREVKKRDRIKNSPGTTSAVPDYAYQALRLEFGLGVRAVPHWRPALSSLRRNPKKLFREDPTLLRYLDPEFRGWKSARSKVKNTISRAEAKKFAPFMKRLGV